jgi:hypothetical protein
MVMVTLTLAGVLVLVAAYLLTRRAADFAKAEPKTH